MRSLLFPARLALLGLALVLPVTGPVHAGGGLVAPKAGEIYKEFHRVNNVGNSWRVTDPNATNAGSPGNSPADFLPNDELPLTINDLAGAVRAEVLVDMWGGHVGTTNKRLRFNDNDWILLPEIDTTPTDGQCYTQQINAVVDVPLEHLVQGTNIVEGIAGGQTCYNFNWGQWGWYTIAVRVYYDASKLHTTGTIAAPAADSVIGEDPLVQMAFAPGADVTRVDVLAWYDGYDEDGDGRFLDWHRSYHRLDNETDNPIRGHVGSMTSAPWETVWDTELVPDQPAGSIKLQARVRNSQGVWYVTPEVDGLTLQREGSVRFYRPNNVPEHFWVRDGQTQSSKVTIPSAVPLGDAVSAKLLVSTWNGIDGQAEAGQEHYTRLNGSAWEAPLYGESHYHSFDILDVPTSALRSGNNTVTFHSDSAHHGIEILWPGPGLIVRFASVVPQECGDGNIDPGEQCDDSNTIPKDGCDASCRVDEVEIFRSPEPTEFYREYSRIMTGNKEWRVTDPNARATGSPGNSPADFLPNPQLPVVVDDLVGAVRAEAVIDMWGGHVGTTDKRFRLNGNEWIPLPELGTPPTDGQCYAQQINIVRDVPLEFLVEGTNILEGTSGGQTCYNFRWGQWGWYEFTLRVYYDPAAKGGGHPTGAIVSPAPGSIIGDNPTLHVDASAPAGIDRVEFYAWFDGYDTDGDGIYTDWQHSYHREKADTDAQMDVSNHVGTATSEPWEVVWDTDLVPDQPGGSIRLTARIRDLDGNWFVTDEIGELTLDRPDRSVRLYKPHSVPERFWVRNGITLSSRATIPTGDDLSHATGVKLLVRTWNGIDGQAEAGQGHYTRVNSWTAPNYGENHTYSFDVVDVPVNRVVNGTNTVTFHSDSSHHGIEVLWPGPALLVQYDMALPMCGDGNIDDGEECDDRNVRDDDACNNDCVANFCGDGLVNNGEICDDGNAENGDGCDTSCYDERCGNGIVQPGEECDDGNNEDGDGCTADCVARICGDGAINGEGEECDDGNDVDDDACGNDCTINFCGDFETNNGEDCDDGNADAGDGCDPNCFAEICGNSVVQSGEECDDGNANDDDRCRADCVANYCGDGLLNNGESCDDGNGEDQDGCDSNCIESVVLNLVDEGSGALSLEWTGGMPQFMVFRAGQPANVTAAENAIGTTATRVWADATPESRILYYRVASLCGDGVLDEGEQCDDGNNLALDLCRPDCTAAECGDGILDVGEECDDGNGIGGDGCQPGCLLPACGDGIHDLGEECDDGNLESGDGCRADCTLELCGDGILDDGEECDDGNGIGGDGCQPDCLLPICGDGIQDPVEECDDGNATQTDACTNDCVAAACGDGILYDGVEQCDDGNTVPDDGCSAICEIEPFENVIVNGDFASGTQPWKFFTNGVATFGTGTGEGIVAITTQGSNVQLYQMDLPIDGGATYRLTFKARSTAGRDLVVRLQQHEAPNTNYGLDELIDLTAITQEYVVEFTTTPGDKTDARFMFWIGPFDLDGTTYVLDDVELKRITGP